MNRNLYAWRWSKIQDTKFNTFSSFWILFNNFLFTVSTDFRTVTPCLNSKKYNIEYSNTLTVEFNIIRLSERPDKVNGTFLNI